MSAKKKPLTLRQSQVLQLIKERWEASGEMPGYDEIAGIYGFKSVSAGREMCIVLVDKGYLEACRSKGPGYPWTFRLVEEETVA